MQTIKALINRYRLHNPQYDDLLKQFVESVATLYSMPCAFLAIAENDHFWYKAKAGVTIDRIDLANSFSHQVVTSNQSLLIEDTLNKPEHQNNHYVVNPPHIRFYAAVPFRLNGVAVGSFGLFDDAPRKGFQKELILLENLSQHLSECVELISNNLRTSEEHQLLNNSPAALIHWQVRPRLSTTFLSNNVGTLLGIAYPEDLGAFKLDEHIKENDLDAFLFSIKNHQQGALNCECDIRINRSSGQAHWFKMISRGVFENKTLVAIQGLLINNAEQKYLEKRILNTNERMSLLLEASGLGTSDWDIQNDNLRVNNRWCDILGLHPDSVDSSVLFWNQLVHPADKRRLSEIVQDNLRGHSEFMSFEYRIKHARGHWLWVETYGKVVTRDENGKPLRMAATHRDITEKKTAELQTERQRRLFSFINHAQNLFVAQRDIQQACEKIFPELLELADSDYGFIGRVLEEDGAPCLHIHAISDISWSSDSAKEYARFKEGNLRFTNLKNLFGHVVTSQAPVIANQPSKHRSSVGTPNGHPLLKRFLGLPISRDGQTVGMIGLANKLEDYTQADVDFLSPLTNTLAYLFKAVDVEQARYDAEKRLEYLAATDPLTSLMNRRAYFAQIDNISHSRNTEICIAIFDVDNFKHLNDTYGHPVGDICLVEISNAIRQLVRESDVIARLGGEEFGLYIDSQNQQFCQTLLDELRESIKKVVIETDKGPLTGISISIGATMVPSLANEYGVPHIEEHMKNADDALYIAKSEGKDCVRWFVTSQATENAHPNKKSIK
ncbi:MAG: diguanylate cyclase [Paraglaciecola sp.]|uniref:sensor domain-containing diguanylate cyclase n=1 Tax=Paraglaciecola sp. TaxID=1920173 RepID=UPI00273FB104|nr:diguanylate cyclase [Paraglaciecola sp.]MDP5029923.1 diguanylate cyclase [Paraglaciecola sp.]MDP5133975.1 diguanylate cyclase [Paraglaciecola sp.]